MDTQQETELKSENVCCQNVDLAMLTVKGLEKYAQIEIEQLTQPISMRIMPGIIIASFTPLQMSVSLLQQMRDLRSVRKIVCLIDQFSDIPTQQTKIQNYLNTKVLKISPKLRLKYEMAYQCWKYACANDKLFINNASIPFKTRQRFQKEIDSKNENKFKNGNKFHSLQICTDAPVYRCQCDRKGSHEWNSLLIEREIGAPLHTLLGFGVNLKYFDIEVCAIVRDTALLYGLSLICDLHIRNRVSLDYSTILNNCICFLLSECAQISANMTVWDPMCGVGSIVIESKVAHSELKNVKYIGTDINDRAIEQSLINAQYCQLRVNDKSERKIDFGDCDKIEFYDWDICELSEAQMSNECIDRIMSDLPFGHKCGTHKKNRKLYPKVLRTMNRVLKMNGKALLITMERKLLAQLLNENSKQWKYETIEIDVGGFDALLFIITKTANYGSVNTINHKKRSFVEMETSVAANDGCDTDSNSKKAKIID